MHLLATYCSGACREFMFTLAATCACNTRTQLHFKDEQNQRSECFEQTLSVDKQNRKLLETQGHNLHLWQVNTNLNVSVSELIAVGMKPENDY